MSVEFPPSPLASPASSGKPVDVPSPSPPSPPTLQSAFAAVLRRYAANTGGMLTNTMLEILKAPVDNTHLRNQQRQETPSHTNRTDLTQIDRKILDKSELRQHDLSTDYQRRGERQVTVRNEYHEKLDRRESSQPSGPVASSQAATLNNQSLDQPRPSEPPPSRNDAPQQRIATEIASASPLAAGVAAPNNIANNGAAGWGMSMPVNAPAMPLAVAPQVVPPQTFTIFTPLGRWGQTQEKSDDKEDEEEKEERATDKKPGTKKTPFAIFEAIHTEITRPPQRKSVRREPQAGTHVQQVAEKLRVKPRENEPDQPQNTQAVEMAVKKAVRTLDELLHTSQHVLVQKADKAEKPDQMRYLRRIADACEAASHFAPVRIKINLDHLGTLSLRFFFQSDRLMLRFETPTKESARFLREHLAELRTIISERNVKLASVEVWLTGNDAA